MIKKLWLVIYLFKMHESQVVRENKKVTGEAMTMEETGNTNCPQIDTGSQEIFVNLISMLHGGNPFIYLGYLHLLI